MSFDGYFTHAMVMELNQALSGGRLSKIHQPYDNEVVLVIRHQGKNHRLLLSSHPSYGRIQLTEIPYENPATPPNFCMTLRKHLENGIIEKIEQIQNDRIVQISFTKRNELGDLEDLRLIIEIMGRHSNIILINQESQKIIDCIKHVGSSQNSYRLLLPGALYRQPPQQAKKNPWEIDDVSLFHLLNAEELSADYLQETFQGLSFLTAQELTYRLSSMPNDKMKAWYDFFITSLDAYQPAHYLIDNKEYFTAIRYHSLQKEPTIYDTLSALLDVYYQDKANRDRVKQQSQALEKRLTNDIKRLRKKLKSLNKDMQATHKKEEMQRKGELLTTYLHLVQPGMSELEVTDYYTNEPLVISLNPQRTPAENAQSYFKRYNKYKTGAVEIAKQLAATQQEIDYIESVLSQLELAQPQDVPLIKEELIESGYLKRKKEKGKPKKLPRFIELTATDGTPILIGRNNLQNDELTTKVAHKNHIWLHAKDIPGSHVIIKDSNPSEQTLSEAAALAAYHSKYRLSNNVPVDYVQVKHVKKPKGAKPGFVIYENQKTLYVTPKNHI